MFSLTQASKAKPITVRPRASPGASLSGRLWYQLGRTIVAIYARLLFRLDIRYLAPLPDGPKVIVANHPTTTDPFLIHLITPQKASILISDTLFQVPLFGGYLRLAGHVPVIEGNGRAALEAAKRILQAGGTVVIFPEGAISPLSGGFCPPHTGAARLALSTGAPLIPVGIDLQRERIQLIESRVEGRVEVGTWYTRGPYTMTVGEPLYLHGDLADRAHVRSLSEQVMGRIIHLARESALRLKEAQGRPAQRRGRPRARWALRPKGYARRAATRLPGFLRTSLVGSER